MSKAGGYAALHPQFTLYESDGRGRDTYISYNNGGFWKENINKILPRENYNTYRYRPFVSLSHRTAPFSYYSDGSGRDTYILKDNSGLTKTFVPLKSFELKDFLRNSGQRVQLPKKLHFSKGEIKYNKGIRVLEKSLVNRLYNDEREKFLPSTRYYKTEGSVPAKKSVWKCYARTSQNFFNHRKDACVMPSVENHQVHFRNGKKKVRVTLEEVSF